MVDLMMFKDFDEFLLKRHKLKIYYVFLPYKDKRQYKRYIYDLPYRESVKDTIWCFLNEIENEYDYEMNELERLYARNKNYIKL